MSSLVHTIDEKRLSAGLPMVESIEPRLLYSGALPYGGVVSGSLAGTQALTYSFTAKRGATVELNSVSTAVDSGFSAYFTLTSPIGAKVTNFSNNSSEVIRNLLAGTYQVSVQDYYGGHAGSFKLGLTGISPINPMAVALKKGGTVSGKFTGPIDVNEYTFTLKQPTTVQIATDSTAIDNGFSAYFQLYSSNGARLDSFSNHNLTVENNLPAGKYMIEAKDYYHGHKGVYGINLQFLSGTFSPDVKPLADAKLTSGEISDVIVSKQYNFSLGKTTTVQFSSDSVAIDSGFSAYFQLYNSKGKRIDTFSNHARVTEKDLPAGDYMVEVWDFYGSSRGTFSFRRDELSTPFDSTAVALVRGVKAAGSIDGINLKEYTFKAVLPSANFVTTASPIDPGFSAYFQVFDSTGVRVASWSNSTKGTVTGLKPGGKYLLMVTDFYGSNRGTYDVVLI
jgi:hypothetical protein